MSVVKLSKGDFRVRSKGDTGLEDRTVEQDDGFVVEGLNEGAELAMEILRFGFHPIPFNAKC